jgi:hypothetical protein
LKFHFKTFKQKSYLLKVICKIEAKKAVFLFLLSLNLKNSENIPNFQRLINK